MSNQIFDAWLPQHLATLTRKIPVQQDPLGYGTDVVMIISEDGVLDIDPMRRQTNPQDIQGIFQSAIRRLATPSGRLRLHPRYGYDVLGLVNKGITQTFLSTLPAQVERELRKDERVLSAKCRAYQEGTDTLTLEISIQPKGRKEAFEMTFSASGDGKLAAELVK